MSYFNYHALAGKLIKSNHCIYAQIKKKHNQISPALVLYFDNHRPMPIRIHKWDYYFLLLSDYSVDINSEFN